MLLFADAEVILAGRKAGKGQEALRRIRAQHPDAKLRFELLDRTLGVGHFADENVAGGVNAAFGAGVKHF